MERDPSAGRAGSPPAAHCPPGRRPPAARPAAARPPPTAGPPATHPPPAARVSLPGLEGRRGVGLTPAATSVGSVTALSSQRTVTFDLGARVF